MTLSLAEIVFWIAAALCVVAEVAILRAALRPAVDPPPASIPHSSRGSDLLLSIIPAVGLGFVLAATWRALH